MSAPTPATLLLEDGTVFHGTACGARGETCGEVCFNTSMTGYEEIISDPSYAGQLIVMTYPHIGNYGVNSADLQNDELHLRGLVVRDMCWTPSNWRCEESLPSLLVKRGIVAIEGIDTRALTRHIRDHGAMRAILSTVDTDESSLLAKVQASLGIVGVNLVKGVSHPDIVDVPALDATGNPTTALHHVIAYDCGAKRSIITGLQQVGCAVTRVPWDYPAHEVLARVGAFTGSNRIDGVFFSNGPGDPSAVPETSSYMAEFLGQVPVFGICLGHQMMSIAAGATIEKLSSGHHGGNQPVMNLRTGVVEITAQNHGFGLVFPSLGDLLPETSGGIDEHFDDLREWSARRIAPVVRNERFGRIQLTHVNLNDGTPEGMAFLDIPAFSVQYHPEANPGPHDAAYLFEAFVRLMDRRDDFLDIDMTTHRLATFGTSHAGGATDPATGAHPVASLDDSNSHGEGMA